MQWVNIQADSNPLIHQRASSELFEQGYALQIIMHPCLMCVAFIFLHVCYNSGCALWLWMKSLAVIIFWSFNKIEVMTGKQSISLHFI